MNGDFFVRKFQPADRAALRKIACETSFLELPHHSFFDDEETLADALTGYFTDYEPQSCFVAEHGNQVVGYLTGAKSIARMNRVFRTKIFFPFLLKAFKRGIIFRQPNFGFFLKVLRSFFKGEFRQPALTGDYPATLHINVYEKFRHSGVGRQMMERYFVYLRESGIGGVQLGTFSEKGRQFFEKSGFITLMKKNRTYLSEYACTPVYYYLMAKKII